MKLRNLALALFSALWLSASAGNEKTEVEQVTGGVQLTTDVDYIVTGTTPFTASGSVDIVNTDHAVLIISNIKPSKVLANWMDYIYINGEKAVNGENCQVKMYGRGAIVFPYAKGLSPLTCYTEQNFEGESCNTYTEGHSGGYMKTLGTANLNNKIRSFKLKRGYMVTFAIGTGGWGYSRCFIADQEDLEVSTLPAILDNRISSYRIFPWFNFHKAGIANATGADICEALNVSGCYSFGLGENRGVDTECVPHHIYEDWPSSSACGSVAYSPHLKTNNEPRNSADDHPQDLKTILNNWQNLMRTGMRLCTPSSWDGSDYWNGTGFLKEFIDSIDAKGWRCDIFDAHGYWTEGSFTTNLPNWYNATKRPIWISEWVWGASWNSNGAFANGVTEAQNAAAVERICTNLNKMEYVERYFYWNSERDPSKVYKNGSLTATGKYYANMEVGLGYNTKYEFIPKETRLEDIGKLSSDYNRRKATVALDWTDPNGDLMNEIEVRCKLPEATAYTTIATVTPKDKNSSGGVSYSYTATVDEPGTYTFQIRAKAYNNKYYTSSEAIVNVAPAQGTSEIQYGKLVLDNLDANTIYYSEEFDTAPCVFIGAMTNKNSSLRAGNRTAATNGKDKFTYQLRPWSYDDGKKYEATMSKSEEIPFLALKAGNYTFGDIACEVGTIKEGVASSDVTWTDTAEVAFEKAFPEGVTPVVLTEIRNPNYATGTSTSALNCRVFDVTNTGFKYIIYSEYLTGRKITASQNVCYCAIAPGLGTADKENGIIIAAGHGDTQVYGSSQRENLFTIAADDEEGNPTTEQLYFNSPVVIAQLQTNNFPAVSMLRRTDSTEKDEEGNTWTTGVKIKRILDRELTIVGEDGTKTTVSSTSSSASTAAYRDNIGWVAISKVKEGGSVPTSIVATPANGDVPSLNPRVVDRRIVVDGVAAFEVYSITGAKVEAKSTLESGIYVVKANGKSAKVLVK